jgi:hypothetical protein
LDPMTVHYTTWPPSQINHPNQFAASAISPKHPKSFRMRD